MNSNQFVALIDYGAGNPASVIKAFTAIGARVQRAATPDQVAGAGLIVIPGVGHFRSTAALDASWRRAITAHMATGATLLGICLGLQWLFDGSDEAPSAPGLGCFGGQCFRLSGNVKVPHVGWNTLQLPANRSPIFDGLAGDASVYFTHTFAAPIVAGTTAIAWHGLPFSAAVERGRVIGTQFHPEKSGSIGLRILANILAIAEAAR